MSKKTFKNLMARKTAEFTKWAREMGLAFKTTSEIERERSLREREEERVRRQRENDRYERNNERKRKMYA
jgi:hypothetical protein